MDFKTALFCEFDKYAAESYCAVHGIDPALNIGDITKADEKMVICGNCVSLRPYLT